MCGHKQIGIWEVSKIIILIIIEAFIKRRIPGKTTCSKALQYRGSYKKLNKVISSDKLYNQ